MGIYLELYATHNWLHNCDYGPVEPRSGGSQVMIGLKVELEPSVKFSRPPSSMGPCLLQRDVKYGLLFGK